MSLVFHEMYEAVGPWAFSNTGEEAQAWQRAYDAQQLPAQRRRAARLKGRRGKRR